MKKKLMLVLLLFVLMIGLNPHSMTEAQTTITQGDQFEQGKYDLSAEYPFGQNWNRNSPYAGTDINKVKWEFKLYYKDGGLQGFGTQPVIGRDGTIYVGNQNGKLYALNKDGSVKWSKDNVAGLFGTPVIAEDGTIYTVGGKLTALNTDGSIKWQTKDTNINETPSIGNDGTIYVHNFYNVSRLEAYNSDGTLKWASDPLFNGSSRSISSLISKDGTIYTFLTSGETNYLYAHDKNGKKLWEKQVWGQGQTPGFTLGLNDEIYINGGTRFSVFDKNGNLIKQWETNGPSYAFSAPTINSKDGTIYVGGQGGLYAYNPDFTLKWKYTLPSGYIVGAPIIDKNGVIYFTPSGPGAIYAINPDGTLKWKLPDSAPFIVHQFSNNSITIDKDGTLYAFGQGGTGNELYYSMIAIGDDYTDTVCTKESTYMEVLKSLEAKSKNANLTEAEKQEARDILNKLSNDLNTTGN